MKWSTLRLRSTALHIHFSLSHSECKTYFVKTNASHHSAKLKSQEPNANGWFYARIFYPCGMFGMFAFVESVFDVLDAADWVVATATSSWL